MTFKNLSSTYLLALLYAYKTDLNEACEKFLVPKSFLEEIYMELEEEVSKRDFRLMIVLELLRRGESTEKIAEAMNWRDFEHFVAKYFEENEYTVLLNYRIRRPRREIDLVALKFSSLLCIDCKNWNIPLTSSSLDSVVYKQLERCCFLKEEEKFKEYKIYPVIVVMRKGNYLFFHEVPIIPINSLREFINKLEYLIVNDELKELSC